GGAIARFGRSSGITASGGAYVAVVAAAVAAAASRPCRYVLARSDARDAQNHTPEAAPAKATSSSAMHVPSRTLESYHAAQIRGKNTAPAARAGPCSGQPLDIAFHPFLAPLFARSGLSPSTPRAPRPRTPGCDGEPSVRASPSTRPCRTGASCDPCCTKRPCSGSPKRPVGSTCGRWRRPGWPCCRGSTAQEPCTTRAHFDNRQGPREANLPQA